jgi:hypothetical protein
MPRILKIAGIGIALVLAMPSKAASVPAWETSIYPEDQIFPSFVISTATQSAPKNPDAMWDCPTMGDGNGLIGALVHNVKKGDQIKVVVKANSLMQESAFMGVSPKTTKDLLVHPKVKYLYDALANVHQHEPLDVSIETWVNGQSQGEQTETVDVHSINDCLFAVVDDSGNIEYDANWNFAAYVNEDHPWVDHILKDALDTKIVDAFDGYQDSKEDVLLQIYAIWNVMQHRDMHYSSITTTASESETVLSQYVRLLDESVRARQANCVDGSVLFAAVLRKIGLQVFLVTEPSHMFVGVNLKENDDNSMIGIETTMLGDKNPSGQGYLNLISKSKRDALKADPSFQTFEAAVKSATGELDKHEKDFGDADDPEYQIIDIAEARSQGIMPIAFVSRNSGDGKAKQDQATKGN